MIEIFERVLLPLPRQIDFRLIWLAAPDDDELVLVGLGVRGGEVIPVLLVAEEGGQLLLLLLIHYDALGAIKRRANPCNICVAIVLNGFLELLFFEIQLLLRLIQCSRDPAFDDSLLD